MSVGQMLQSSWTRTWCTTMRDLTVVTLSRTLDYFAQLLDSLDKQVGEMPKYLGVLVNNASDASMSALALSHCWAALDPGYNTTYSAGNNLAVETIQKSSPSEWLLFLNDDAIPEPTWLAELWSKRELADVVGCLLLNQDGTVNHAGTEVSAKGLGGCSNHLGRNQPREDFSGFAYTPSVTFAAALVNAGTFERVGGFDPRYNYGFEDTDFCLKVIADGGRVGCARDAVAIHDECGTRPRGGEADQHNVEQFIQTWKHRLFTVLSEYVKDMKPELVEGALWR